MRKNKILTAKELQSRGGKKCWEGIPPHERSKRMRKVRLKGLKKKK